MSVLGGLMPRRVFEIFEDLTRIPRGSGNTKEVEEYLVNYAIAHGFKYVHEEIGNVIIFVDGRGAGKGKDSVMLQGHMDMVCEKTIDSRHNFRKDPLPIAVMDDYVYAKQTTLGGDDGIAIAYALALAEDEHISHPPLEIVITVDEEVGMEGARKLDTSVLSSKTLINIDSEEEGSFVTSCAGGLRGKMEVPVRYKAAEGEKYNIIISGLKGGHSGSEIDKYQANANILMGRLLHFLGINFKFHLVSLRGGLMDNAIPRDADCTVIVSEEDGSKLESVVGEFEKTIKNEYRANEKNIQIYCNGLGYCEEQVLRYKTMERLIFLLNTVPDGVQCMSMEPATKGLVQTSLNNGIMRLDEKSFTLEASVRSSIASQKYALSERLKYLTETIGGQYSVWGDYPGWEFSEDSRITRIVGEKYEELFGKKPLIAGIHAGLECGFISSKMPGIDIVSLGPDIIDIHTPGEKISISSVERVWRLLIAVLEELCK